MVILENFLLTGSIVAFIAFGSSYVNSLIGGGYGTLSTPFLLLVGLEPIQFIPSILLSHGLISLILIWHMRRTHRSGKFCEVDSDCFYNKHALRYIISFGVVGLILSLFFVSYLDGLFVKIYIGSLTIILGLILLTLRKRGLSFSKARIMGISIIAAFNKGISGGGYGTVISCGQILSGVGCRQALSTSYYAEAVISLLGFSLYLILMQIVLPLEVILFMIAGSVVAVPFAMKSLEKVTNFKLTLLISIVLISLGAIIILQTSLSSIV